MGQGGAYRCDKCGYQVEAWTGMGFLYPMVCEENIEKAKNGELGEELKKLFEEYPNGKLDCQEVLKRCENCGEYEVVTDLGFYIPENNEKANEDIWNLDGYKKIESYKHLCASCGGELMDLESGEGGYVNLVCPQCGETLELVDRVLWD